MENYRNLNAEMIAWETPIGGTLPISTVEPQSPAEVSWEVFADEIQAANKEWNDSSLTIKDQDGYPANVFSTRLKIQGDGNAEVTRSKVSPKFVDLRVGTIVLRNLEQATAIDLIVKNL